MTNIYQISKIISTHDINKESNLYMSIHMFFVCLQTTILLIFVNNQTILGMVCCAFILSLIQQKNWKNLNVYFLTIITVIWLLKTIQSKHMSHYL